MAEISSLLTLQGQLALLTLIGFFLARKGIINAQGRKCLTDLLINVILPANIIQSFLVEFSWDVLKSSASILVISLALQIGCVVLCAWATTGCLCKAERLPVWHGLLQRCVSGQRTGGRHLGQQRPAAQLHLPHPPARGNVVGGRELLSAGRKARFQRGDAGRPQGRAAENIIHPTCILAVVVGMVLMASQLPLPGFLGRTVKSLSNCNMGVSMILIGAIIGSSRMGKLWDKDCFLYCLIRLGLIPAAVLLGCRLCGVESLVTGVSVVLAAMPMGGVTAVLAEKYGGDSAFASKCVAVSTVLSLITTPLWCMIV